MNTRQGRRQARLEKKKQAHNKKGPTKKGILKKIMITLMTLAIIAVVGGGITAFAIIQGAPDLDEEKLTLSQAAQILSLIHI